MTTQLQVLNYMLSVIGEAPVSSPDSTHPSAISASTVLDDENKQMQERGWWYNTESGLLLSPNLAGEIILPQNTLAVDPVSTRTKLVQRGGKLYDPVNHTYNIGEAVRVDIVLKLPIEDLPETAATYLMKRCAYIFYANDDGDEQKCNRLEREMGRAWAFLQQQELQVTDVNALERESSLNLRSGMSPSSYRTGKLPV